MPRKKQYIRDKELNDMFHKYLEMRKKIKKPATDYAIELAIEKLREISKDKNMAIKILKQSIFNSWQGLFPLREEKYKEYTYREITDMITKDGYSMSDFERIEGTKLYRKIK